MMKAIFKIFLFSFILLSITFNVQAEDVIKRNSAVTLPPSLGGTPSYTASPDNKLGLPSSDPSSVTIDPNSGLIYRQPIGNIDKLKGNPPPVNNPGPKSNTNQPTTGLVVCKGTDCDTWKELIDSIEKLIQFMFKLAVVAATISIAYAGFLYLTAMGDEGKIKQAHGIFWMIVKGFFIMLLAYLLVRLILTTLVVGEGFNLLE